LHTTAVPCLSMDYTLQNAFQFPALCTTIYIG
jgi:hypothetical protein